MKITVLEEFTDFATLDPDKLFSKLKSHELFRKGRSNHDTPHFSKALISSARVGGHDANPTNTTNAYALEFVLSSLAAASDEQYKSIPDDKIALLATKFRVLHRFTRRVGDHRGAASSAATPPTSSSTVPTRRSSTPPLTSTTTTTRTTPTTRVRARRSIALRTRRIRRSSIR
jgi:hypothetical protein